MRKKLLIGCLAAAMMMSLGACGKKDSTTDASTTQVETTAEAVASDVSIDELLKNVKYDETKTADTTMTAEMVLSADVPNDKGETQHTEISANMSMDMKFNSKGAYATGVVKTAAGEESEVSNIEMYSVTEDDGTITVYTSDGETWTKEPNSENPYSSAMITNNLTSDNLIDATVSESDSEYIITGQIDYKSISADNDLLNEFAIDDGTNSMSTLPVKIIFDKATKEFKFFEVSSDQAIDIMGMTLDKYVITLTNNGYSDDEIVVPEEVIKSAVENTVDISTDTDIEDMDTDVEEIDMDDYNVDTDGDDNSAVTDTNTTEVVEETTEE